MTDTITTTNTSASALMTDAEYYKETREILHYESELINRRLTWLITSQAITFAAIAATAVMSKDGIRPKAFDLMFMVGAAMGVAISLSVLGGVGAAIAEAHHLYREFEGRATDDREKLQTTRLYRRRDRRLTLFLGEFTALLLPSAFFAAWGFAIGRHYQGLEKSIEWDWPAILVLLIAPPLIAAGITGALLFNDRSSKQKKKSHATTPTA